MLFSIFWMEGLRARPGGGLGEQMWAAIARRRPVGAHRGSYRPAEGRDQPTALAAVRISRVVTAGREIMGT
jgi:hypothetical protein